MRINPRVLFGLTVAQIVSLVLIVIGGWLFSVTRQDPTSLVARA